MFFLSIDNLLLSIPGAFQSSLSMCPSIIQVFITHILHTYMYTFAVLCFVINSSVIDDEFDFLFSCEETAQQVLMSLCQSVSVWTSWKECSRIFYNACRMFQNITECMQNVPECSIMQFYELACSFMSLHAISWACMQFHSLSEQLKRISQCLVNCKEAALEVPAEDSVSRDLVIHCNAIISSVH